MTPSWTLIDGLVAASGVVLFLFLFFLRFLSRSSPISKSQFLSRSLSALQKQQVIAACHRGGASSSTILKKKNESLRKGVRRGALRICEEKNTMLRAFRFTIYLLGCLVDVRKRPEDWIGMDALSSRFPRSY